MLILFYKIHKILLAASDIFISLNNISNSFKASDFCSKKTQTAPIFSISDSVKVPVITHLVQNIFLTVRERVAVTAMSPKRVFTQEILTA